MRLTTTITILALFISVFAACGQTGKDKRTSLLKSIQKKSALTLGKSQDTAFLRKAAEVYGDSILIQMDNFLTDTALIKKMDATYEKDKVKGILSKHKIEDQESMVGPMNDYGNVFFNSELTYLDSILYKHFEKTASLVSIVTLDSSILKGNDFHTQLTKIKEGWDICNF